jgi:hypothetical protein
MATVKLLGATSGYTELAAASVATPTTFTLPAADGTVGQALTTSGTGVLSWTTVTSENATNANFLKVGLSYRSASVDVPGEGTANTIAVRDVDGNLNAVLFQGTATSSRYADLAEKYVADAAYEPGTVLMFGGNQEVTLADEDTVRIAGVVSFNPGFIMNSHLECVVSLGERTAVIALQGRVPVGIFGPVKKGDLMVSAGGGRAKPATDPKLGSVIGKALEDFDGEEGVIEIVVGRL